MTPLPKRKISSRRQGKRRAAIKLPNLNLAPCPSCGRFKASHVICPHCGYYKGKPYLEIKSSKEKKHAQS